jgi:hypothetical protein
LGGKRRKASGKVDYRSLIESAPTEAKTVHHVTPSYEVQKMNHTGMWVGVQSGMNDEAFAIQWLQRNPNTARFNNAIAVRVIESKSQRVVFTGG